MLPPTAIIEVPRELSETDVKGDALDVSRLLEGVSRTVRSTRFCWLATASEDGIANVRPMGRLLPEAGESNAAWKIVFFTDGRSPKAADIRRNSRVTLIFQHDADDAFVALTGKADLVESKSEVDRRWTDAYNAFLPSPEDREHVVFVDVDIERMELWIRGVTPEPFGFHTTKLERDTERGWRVAG